VSHCCHLLLSDQVNFCTTVDPEIGRETPY
jgi:hypothetical protein